MSQDSPQEKEQETTPSREASSTLPVVGIGTSAGGLAALREFFGSVPADSGVAYVVIVHLSPEYESHMAELLQGSSNIPVTQVSESTPLKPDQAYVIPPNANLEAIDTHLRLQALEEARKDRAPIDHFFRTLSVAHEDRAIGVVLTGTGSDGALGVKEIKERGGLTIAQDPTEAEHAGMPQSAIATGVVDLVLPLSRISEAILSLVRTRPEVAVLEEVESQEQKQLLQKLFVRVRGQTGKDFSRYKESTILRRISRRMQLLQVEDLSDYVDMLREDPEEIRALADQFLINVTNFFRDPEVFQALEKDVIPRIFQGKDTEEDIRVWSVGCATGEEAYSLAILLAEEASRRNTNLRPQIFASDLHDASLRQAREGFYPGEIEADVGQERLKRFFRKEDGGYRIREEIRELVVFAPHDLLSDPPFSRLDLILCRNVLIYLQRDVQQDVMGLFHYALRPDGFLAIGSSETIDPSGLFRQAPEKHPIYQRRDVPPPELRLPVFPMPRARTPGEPAGGPPPPPASYGALHHRMVERYAPPSRLVGPDGKVVHLSEHAGRYLEHPGGEPTSNVHKLVREELRIELRAALHAAMESRTPQRSAEVAVRFNGETRSVVLHVRPAREQEDDGFALVIFDESGIRMPPPGGERDAGEGTGDEEESEAAAGLRAELDLTRERLQGVIEEYETGQEELRASNEELQSSNEELRSTLEELETSKEELQSMNEELQTVNQDNRLKVEELAQLTADLQSLLSSTEIATLFLDRQLRILRYTPKIAELFSVRPADRGRPLSDLTHRLDHGELQDEVEGVLRTLIPVEREIQDAEGRWYLTRILPYRSAEDRIEGAVITFVDITRRKEAEEKLRSLNETLEREVEERTRQVREKENRLRKLAARLSEAEEAERRRVRDLLHDDLQQLLYGIQMKLTVAQEQGRGKDTHLLASSVDTALELVEEAIGMTRRLTTDLARAPGREASLPEALQHLKEEMLELHGLSVEITEEQEDMGETRESRALLKGILRELLFNVARHADTGEAGVEIEKDGEMIRALVGDGGRGFDPAILEGTSKGPGGLGLRTIREQVELHGGKLRVDSSPGNGTRITVSLPGNL